MTMKKKTMRVAVKRRKKSRVRQGVGMRASLLKARLGKKSGARTKVSNEVLKNLSSDSGESSDGEDYVPSPMKVVKRHPKRKPMKVMVKASYDFAPGGALHDGLSTDHDTDTEDDEDTKMVGKLPAGGTTTRATVSKPPMKSMVLALVKTQTTTRTTGKSAQKKPMKFLKVPKKAILLAMKGDGGASPTLPAVKSSMKRTRRPGSEQNAGQDKPAPVVDLVADPPNEKQQLLVKKVTFGPGRKDKRPNAPGGAATTRGPAKKVLEDRAKRAKKAEGLAQRAGRQVQQTEEGAKLVPRSSDAQLTLPGQLAVGPEAQQQYEVDAQEIVDWLQKHQNEAKTNEDLVFALLERWEQRFMDGFPASSCTKEYAAVCHYVPELKNLNERMERCMQGWGKSFPGGTRYPFSEGVAATLAVGLIGIGKPLMVLCCWLQYKCHLRPGEAVNLRIKDLMAPLPLLGAPHWTVGLGDLADGKPTKSGEFDASVAVDSDPWLSPYLHELTTGRQPTEKVFPFTLLEYEQSISKVVEKYELEPLGVVPYSLRHSGITNDIVLRRRTEDEAVRRARWKTRSSLRRYGKPGVLQRQMAKLKPAVRDVVVECEKKLQLVFQGVVAAPVLQKWTQAHASRGTGRPTK